MNGTLPSQFTIPCPPHLPSHRVLLILSPPYTKLFSDSVLWLLNSLWWHKDFFFFAFPSFSPVLNVLIHEITFPLKLTQMLPHPDPHFFFPCPGVHGCFWALPSTVSPFTMPVVHFTCRLHAFWDEGQCSICFISPKSTQEYATFSEVFIQQTNEELIKRWAHKGMNALNGLIYVFLRVRVKVAIKNRTRRFS